MRRDTEAIIARTDAMLDQAWASLGQDGNRARVFRIALHGPEPGDAEFLRGVLLLVTAELSQRSAKGRGIEETT